MLSAATFRAVLIAAVPILAAAQNQSEIPKFGSQVELVTVPVVVTRGGKHLSGLTADNFDVREDGVRQKVAVFQEINLIQAQVRREKPKAGVFTNRLAGNASERRVTVVIFDLLNTPVLYQQNARDEFVKFLENALVPGEPIMILGLYPKGLKVIHSFATDPAVLVAAVRHLKSSHPARGHDDLGAQARDQDDEKLGGRGEQSDASNPAGSATGGKFGGVFLTDPDVTKEGLTLKKFLAPQGGTMDSMVAMRTGENIRATLQAFQQIARALGAVPGRKTLLWVTGGIPFDWMGGRGEYAQLYQETWNLLSAANFAVYPVNVKQDAGEGALFSAQTFGGKPTPQMMRDRISREFVQQSFAAYTGGTVCTFRNDLDTCFKKAVADSSSYYLMAYYARSRDTAGWRKLRVKVNVPGTSVRARSGYFSLGRGAAQDSRPEFVVALASPVDYTSIPISFLWTGTKKDDAKTRHSFLLAIPPDGVTLDSATRHLQIEVVVLVQDSKGEEVARVQQAISGNLTPENAQQVLEGGIQYKHALSLAPGDYSVRIAVRDAATGAMGSLTVPLTSN